MRRVYFTDEQLARAHEIGRKRLDANLKKRTQGRGISSQAGNDPTLSIYGCMGELALEIATGLKWLDFVPDWHLDHHRDNGGIAEARSVIWRKPYLLIKRKEYSSPRCEKFMTPFFLVKRMDSGINCRRFVVVGWAYAWEALMMGWPYKGDGYEEGLIALHANWLRDARADGFPSFWRTFKHHEMERV